MYNPPESLNLYGSSAYFDRLISVSVSPTDPSQTPIFDIPPLENGDTPVSTPTECWLP